MSLSYHPKTGVHYAHMISNENPVHWDVCDTWRLAAKKHPWISVQDPNLSHDHPLFQDPRVLAIYWHNVRPRPPVRSVRQAHVAFVHYEAVGPLQNMIPWHIGEEENTRYMLKNTNIDAVFEHTPGMVGYWKKHGPAYLLPLGYDPEVYGVPDFDSKREYDYVYYGTTAGKRELLIPFLMNRLPGHIHDLSGLFGRKLRLGLNQAKASLYILHADVYTFCTWRIWQSLGASACLVAEKPEDVDCWPMVPGRHFVKLPRTSIDNIENIASELVRILREEDLAKISKTASDELGVEFSVENCIEKHLVPSGAMICES